MLRLRGPVVALKLTVGSPNTSVYIIQLVYKKYWKHAYINGRGRDGIILLCHAFKLKGPVLVFPLGMLELFRILPDTLYFQYKIALLNHIRSS